MQNKLPIVFFATIALLALLRVAIAPSLNKRAAEKVVQSILKDWIENDYLSPVEHWEHSEQYPPVYKLLGYSIKDKRFFKEGGKKHVHIITQLEFDKNNLLPSNSEWLFDLKNTQLGWKVVTFGVSQLNTTDYKKVKQ